jgi:pyrrolidone-carboxylate peptidase
MGVAPFSQVEPRGQNWKSAYPDANGNTVAEGKIEVNGGEDLPTGLPQDAIGQALQKTFGHASMTDAHTTSPDDSAYLCNYMNYRLLESFPKGSGTMAGFVHVTDHTTAEEMQTVVEAAVSRRLEQRRAAEAVSNPPTT